ncbi:uncharacterized protein EpC_11590 [Erwinia pyrifoliae Ep1/96]|nr:uncharacterized protein EpC_11590 [Erwinia pyrifoliae Ep1/96]
MKNRACQPSVKSDEAGRLICIYRDMLLRNLSNTRPFLNLQNFPSITKEISLYYAAAAENCLLIKETS